MTSAEHCALLATGHHHDPHAYLGAHAAPGGFVVRTLRPGAAAVRVLPEGRAPVRMRRIHAAGVYEATVPGQLTAYRIETRDATGDVTSADDPYRFLPTLGELDLHLAAEGRHEELYERLGAHERVVDGVAGTAFAVWAPSARGVAVVGDFDDWDGRRHPMRSLGSSGIWELFLPGTASGALYKYVVRASDGSSAFKADPVAFAAELPPQTASAVWTASYAWRDDAWLDRRERSAPHAEPQSVYEVHLGSWRRSTDGGRPLTYAELGDELADYATDLGFTHVELMPVMHHPFAGSWGYQVTGFFAATPTFGSPDELKAMIDRLHGAGLGVILDWVPAHFPRDEFALARFDGTPLYEHEDPRRGAHPDWGTLIFDYGRIEVRNFLLASALFWLEAFHADGLRVDAVASMLYLDYSRAEGEWLPNAQGGNENLEAAAFLRQLNEVAHRRVPGVIMSAEESTAWPGVTHPTDRGGLGFGFKWNMGWMHDTLQYFSREPVHRRFHHDELTWGLMYAFSENFTLPLSHDEVVHGKGSLLEKMPGDRWQQLANLRALYGFQWAHPGKKLLFMGGELAQDREWSHERPLDWHLLEQPGHAGVQALVRDLNRAYRDEPALWELDADQAGFEWLEAGDAEANVLVFARHAPARRRSLVCACNFSPLPRAYRVGFPRSGRWREVVNTDDRRYGGSGVTNPGGITTEQRAWHGQRHSAEVELPPLGVTWLAPETP